MAIDRIDRTVVTLEFPTNAVMSAERAEPQRFNVLGVTAALSRTAVMVLLASLAILVLLPAAIAAQAASAI